MKWGALLLLAAGLCVGDRDPGRFTGIIHDNRCVGPNCATQCPVTRDPVYTLQSGEQAWVLTDRKTPAQFVGRKVVVTGTVEADNKLKVLSIAPAR
jgi:hypothetical protein